jgi:hypothetical protein
VAACLKSSKGASLYSTGLIEGDDTMELISADQSELWNSRLEEGRHYFYVRGKVHIIAIINSKVEMKSKKLLINMVEDICITNSE